MNYDEAFVQEVRAHPKDDTPRLIFADYLEEAGDPRGEFIRLQVELSEMKSHDPRRRALESREDELLSAFGEQWLAPLRELGAQGTSIRCFHKGLIERIKITPEVWLSNAREICRISPALHQLQLVKARDFLERLGEVWLPDQITSLDLSSNRLEASHIRVLGQAPWIGQIEEVDASFNRLQDEAGAVGMILWPLKRVMLRVNGIGPDGAKALANAESMNNVVSLALGVNSIGDFGIQWLASSPRLTNLEELDLSSNRITTQGAQAIAKSLSLKALTRLNLRSNQIGREGLEAIRQSSALESLELLDLRGNVFNRGRGGHGSAAQEDLLIRFDRSPD